MAIAQIGWTSYPSSVEFASWREVVAAVRRILQANFVAIVSREVVEGAWDGDDPTLEEWPGPQHVVSGEEYWRRYAADNPEFRRRVLEEGATAAAIDPHGPVPKADA